MLRYFVCRFYEEEFRARFLRESVEVLTFSLFCLDEKIINKIISDTDRVFHGPCMKLNQLYNCDPINSCLNWSVGKELSERYISERCYLVTGGWLKFWRQVIIDAYGFNETISKLFFSEYVGLEFEIIKI